MSGRLGRRNGRMDNAINPASADENAKKIALKLIVYVSVICAAMLCIGLGALYLSDLKDKIYIFGPAFLIIVLVMFYGIVLQPRQFAPTRIPRYARRPPPVEELAKLLRASTPAQAGEKLYRVFRQSLCYKLELPDESTSADILSAVGTRYPNLKDNVSTALRRGDFFSEGKKRLMTEKEFVENYTFLINLLYAFDGKLWG